MLRPFGVTRRCNGSGYTVFAIYLAVQDKSRLEAITKEIYMETASHFGCKWSAAERNIRTAVARAWRINRPLLCEMAGYPLGTEPIASEFIEIIASYLLRSSQPQSDLRPVAML